MAQEGRYLTQSQINRAGHISCCLLTKSCPTLFNPLDCSLPGSSVHRISQARILDALPFSSPWDLPDPGIEPMSPVLAVRFFTSELPGKPRSHI